MDAMFFDPQTIHSLGHAPRQHRKLSCWPSRSPRSKSGSMCPGRWITPSNPMRRFSSFGRKYSPGEQSPEMVSLIIRTAHSSLHRVDFGQLTCRVLVSLSHTRPSYSEGRRLERNSIENIIWASLILVILVLCGKGYTLDVPLGASVVQVSVSHGVSFSKMSSHRHNFPVCSCVVLWQKIL
jgi:hypothetical protein